MMPKRNKTFKSDDPLVMSPAAFKRWRKALDLSQKEAAEALGLKRRVVQYYEKGVRDGKDVQIPRTVRLACYALAAGASDYAGPDGGADKASNPAHPANPARKDKQTA